MYLADTNGPVVRGMYIGENTYTVDLRKALPSCFSRPSAQHGWIVRPKDRTTYSFDTSVVCVAKISVSDAAKWLGDGDLLPFSQFPIICNATQRSCFCDSVFDLIISIVPGIISNFRLIV